jgi:hypothetical protein
MRANRAYRLIVTRAGRAPAWLASADRVDHLEIVDVDSGEVVLFWDCAPRDATRRARRLREDLLQLEAGDFIAKWGSQEDPG